MLVRKYFKAKRRVNIKILFWIVLFFITVLTNIITLDNISYSYYFDKSKLFNINIDKDEIIYRMGFNLKKVSELVEPVFDEVVTIPKPSVYIYNTHQTEEYSDTDIYEMSLKFEELLEQSNIDVLVENTNISSVLKENNYSYKDSYKVTRELLLEQISKRHDLYIDVHRDSSKRDVSTVTIDGTSYARVMFVIGKNHDNYKYNYDIVSNLNKLLKNINNKLSRGIYVRESSNYNQDLDKSVILLEIGGPENTSEEVSNTLNVLCDVLEYYFYE